MNKILEKTHGTTLGYQNIDILEPVLWNSVVESLDSHNSYIPAISRVIYNVGTKNNYKTLTTVIFFVDGTKCTVTNSERDGVKFEDAFSETIKVDETGKTYIEKTPLSFQIATHESKEIGLVYCLLKKVFGVPDCHGNVLGNGFGRKLNDIIDAAYDIQEETAKRKAAKAAAKAKYEASKGTAKPKRQRESLAKTVDRLTDILDALQDKIQK